MKIYKQVHFKQKPKGLEGSHIKIWNFQVFTNVLRTTNLDLIIKDFIEDSLQIKIIIELKKVIVNIEVTNLKNFIEHRSD